MRASRVVAPIAAAVAAVLAMTTSLTAQYELGDGRGLDRNLQQGSGGVNAPARSNPYGRYSDAIITGNVGGLGAFRDPVGYRAPGEFRDATSADDTFGFRRRALPQAVQQRPGAQPRGITRNPQLDPARIEGTVLRRGGTGAEAGGVTGQRRAYPGSFLIDDPADAAGRAFVRDRAADAALRDRLSAGGAAAGLLTDERGQLLQVTTSPLTGVRRQVVGERRVPRVPGAVDDQEEDAEIDPRELDPRQIERREEEREREDARRGRVQDGRLGDRAGGRTARVDQRVDQRVDPGRIDPLGDAMDLAQVDRSADIEPGEDAYVDLLRRIDQEVPDGLRLGNRSRPLDEGRERTPLEQIAEDFERTRRGEGIEDDAVAAEDEDDPLDRLARGLSYDLPPVETFVGSGDNQINRLLAQAEHLMEQNRYFQAEAVYERILVLEPDYAIAEMGRVHAQLGAGLYLSAASNLRYAMARHPQLIAARYGEGVMPDESRLRAVENELREFAETDPDAAALLQSYLAYQEQRTGDLQTSLDQLEQTSEEDPVNSLLRRIWLREGDEPAEEQLDPQPEGTDDTDDAGENGVTDDAPSEATPEATQDADDLVK